MCVKPFRNYEGGHTIVTFLLHFSCYWWKLMFIYFNKLYSVWPVMKYTLYIERNLHQFTFMKCYSTVISHFKSWARLYHSCSHLFIIAESLVHSSINYIITHLNLLKYMLLIQLMNPNHEISFKKQLFKHIKNRNITEKSLLESISQVGRVLKIILCFLK